MSELITRDCFLGPARTGDTYDYTKFPLLHLDRIFVNVVGAYESTCPDQTAGFPEGTMYGIEGGVEWPATKPLDLYKEPVRHYYLRVPPSCAGKCLQVRYGRYPSDPVLTSSTGTDWTSLSSRPLTYEVLASDYRPLIEACLEYGKWNHRCQEGARDVSWAIFDRLAIETTNSWEVLHFLDASCYYGGSFVRVLMVYYRTIGATNLFRAAAEMVYYRSRGKDREEMQAALRK